MYLNVVYLYHTQNSSFSQLCFLYWLLILKSCCIIAAMIETNIVKCHNSNFVDLEKQAELQNFKSYAPI